MRMLAERVLATTGVGRAPAASSALRSAGLSGAALRPRLGTVFVALALGAGLALMLPVSRSSAPSDVGSRHLVREGLLSLPLAARSPVSEVLGADAPAYRVHHGGGGYTASNPLQGLSASFRASEILVRAGTTHVRFRLVGVGQGSSLKAVGTASVRTHANRVTYAYRGIDEWYTNGPLGIEQGFTVPKAPAGTATGPLTLAIGLSGNAYPSLGQGEQTIALSRAGKAVLRYTGLSATDAAGRRLRSWLTLDAGRVLIRVATNGARFPLRIDPFVQQGKKLTGAGEVGAGELGYKVALSSDGNTALIGGRLDNGGVGAAWVFTRTGSTWTQQGEKLTGGGESGDGWFGSGVALSADGNTALIGGSLDNGFLGAAWVFTRSGEKWTQQGTKLSGAGETGNGFFGNSVALSADGNTALIGGPTDSGAPRVGAAWVFTRTKGVWTQQGSKLTGSGEVGKEIEFGGSVALSADGNTALIGGPADNSYAGAAWVFKREKAKWSQQGEKLTGAGGVGTEIEFGASLALSADGNTALIGGWRDNHVVGAAWVFTRTGQKWSQQGGKLTGSGETGEEPEFGFSVALSSDGNTALIGAPNQLLGGAFVFTRENAKWIQEGEMLTGSPEATEGSDFGSSVALSSDADTALLGGPGDYFFPGRHGAAWVFVSGPTVSTRPATEVTPTAAMLNATVNPNGVAVGECELEYGATEAYGSSVPCSPAPGSGTSPVTVSGVASGLVANHVYHFRISATNAIGTSVGSDRAFTTLQTNATGETKEPAVPAKATDGGLSVQGSGGTGRVTIGPYGSNIGGPPLPRRSGAYFQVYRSSGATFTTIEYKDCELGGAKVLWWDNPAAGWEPISAPTAVYTETPTPCITVTATEATTPSIAQLADRRHVGGPAVNAQYGKCEPAKHGNYDEEGCLTVAEKNGLPSHKGKYEWYPAPVGCYALKHGRYKDAACQTVDEKKGVAKGKFEAGSNTLRGEGGTATFEIQGTAALTCQSASIEEGLGAPITGIEEVTFTGCEHEAGKCTSPGEQPGTIRAARLESIVYEEDDKDYALLSGFPVMKFTCAGTEYSVAGEVSGEASGDTNTMSTKTETVFNKGTGYQGLKTTYSGKEHETTLATTITLASTQPMELNTTIKG